MNSTPASPNAPRRPGAMYPPSPPLSCSSDDSDDSLGALELSEGPLDARDDDRLLHPREARGRSYSVSGFAFEQDLLPLRASLSEPDSAPGETSEKTIGLFSAIALVVGLQIGSGIFSSPGVVVANTDSVGASLSVWLAAGLLGWTGASSFAELGSSIPVNGGARAYLAYAAYAHVRVDRDFRAEAWPRSLSAATDRLTNYDHASGGNTVVALIPGEYIDRPFCHATVSGDVDEIPEWTIINGHWRGGTVSQQ